MRWRERWRLGRKRAMKLWSVHGQARLQAKSQRVATRPCAIPEARLCEVHYSIMVSEWEPPKRNLCKGSRLRPTVWKASHLEAAYTRKCVDCVGKIFFCCRNPLQVLQRPPPVERRSRESCFTLFSFRLSSAFLVFLSACFLYLKRVFALCFCGCCAFCTLRIRWSTTNPRREKTRSANLLLPGITTHSSWINCDPSAPFNTL